MYGREPKQPEKSSGSKRKRVDDGTPPSSPRAFAISAEPDWDKITFRVSRIPVTLGFEDLSQVLIQMFSVRVTNFSIHSLALDASDKADPPSKTATVSFRTTPALLRGSQDLANYWDFELPAIAAAKFEHCRICFDTHFNGFTPLSPADHIHRPIDCIVIPGWGGHALGSFRSHTSTYVWLRDSLPRHCPELRVWTYGYPSHLTDVKLSADPYEFAEIFKTRLRILRQQTKIADEVRPLIFIAHSLGGWIFKDAIIQMRKSPNEVDQETVLSTYGALFFGVPTQGMDVEAIANMVQHLPARYISTLLDQQVGFRLRQRQHEDFCQAFGYKDSRIVQFFEREKSPTVIQDPETKKWSRRGPLALLVNPASATHGRAWETGSEYTLSLSGNHSDMIKFSNDRDDYPTVRSCLQQFTKQAALVVRNRWKKSSDELESSNSAHLSSEQQECLQSLCFPEMNERRNGIDEPANSTCEWLSKNPTYLKWFDQQHGMLWIKGKPGAGKSTLIKHAVWGLEQSRGGDAVLASFFFHGRGALIQKNIAGLFRSLLHQVLLQLPELLTEFSSLHRKRTEREGQYGVKWEWHEKELRNFFKARVTEAARTRTVRLYIDALDEAGEDTATELVHYFQQLSSSFAVCFSCRHYPLLTLENGLEVCVEDRNGRDIDTYIRISLNARILPEEIVYPIHEDIAAKSSGSFQWVALVIRLILRLYKNGNSLAVLRSKIKQLPSKLSSLYGELLGSVNEEDLSESLVLMQWVLFSLRPLRLSELRFAHVMGQESTCLSIRECQSSSWFSSTDEDLERKVLALSRGLVEVREPRGPRKDCNTSNDDACYDDPSYDSAFHDDVFASWTSLAPVTERFSKTSLVENFGRNVTVQFIHQSVKDFLLEGGLQILDKGPLNNMVGRGHYCLARSCIRYLTMEDIRHCAHDFSYRKNDAVLPLLAYAAQSWHLHSKEVEKRDPALAGLLSMNWRSSDTFTQTWIKVSHMHRVDYVENLPEADWTLFHVASKLNLPSFIGTMLEQGLVADTKDGRGRTPLSIAAEAGNDEVVRMLLDRHDVEPNSVDDNGYTSLYYAVRSWRKSTLSMLLDRNEIDPNAKDDCGISPLFDAIQLNYKAAVELLLDRKDVDLNTQDKYGRTPLSHAAARGNEVFVEMLLDRKDINLKIQDYYGRTPLAIAAEVGSEAIVKLLLNQKNVDPNVRDFLGRTPLYYAAAMDYKDIVQLLLDRNDVDPNTQRKSGMTPLANAALWGREAVVRLLLDRKDIKANVKDHDGRTPLSYAAEKGREGILKLLLDRNDIDPNVQDYSGRTPLSFAAGVGEKLIVKLLLNRNDVDPNVPDNYRRTPLDYAMRYGHMEIATMLRDRMRGAGSLGSRETYRNLC